VHNVAHVLNIDCPSQTHSTPTRAPTPVPSAYDHTEFDLKRFCLSNVADNMRSVLFVDRTFNLSSLFVTVSVFKHRAVLRKASNDHPLFIVCVVCVF